MDAFRKYAIVPGSKELILSDLPFQPGQRVEVVVIAEEEKSRAWLQELRELFRTTQSPPQSRTINEEEIVEEIASYRSGK